MLFKNENGQQHEQLFVYITFTVALLNIFLSSSHSVAKDEWFLYEVSIYKKKEQKYQQQSRILALNKPTAFPSSFFADIGLLMTSHFNHFQMAACFFSVTCHY